MIFNIVKQYSQFFDGETCVLNNIFVCTVSLTCTNYLIILRKTDSTIIKPNTDVKDKKYARYTGKNFIVEKIFDKFYPSSTINNIDDYILNKFYDKDVKFYLSIFPPFYFGNINGYSKVWHLNGNLCCEGNFLFKRVGKWKTYYENGNKNEIVTYNLDGELNGYGAFYHENGKLASYCLYINGKKFGKFKEWHLNSKMKISGEYSHNIKTGLWSYYYSNGFKFEEGKYECGKRKGIWKKFDFNGKNLNTLFYVDGIIK